jgi:sirohydrochlorin ferrochelatase
VVAAFASAARPGADEAVSFLAGLTGQDVAVAAYLLAPGRFHDQLWRGAGAWVSAPLGDHPAVAEVVVDRFRAAAPWPPGPVIVCAAACCREVADWNGSANADRRASA